MRRRRFARALTLAALYQVELGKLPVEEALDNVLNYNDDEILIDLEPSIKDVEAIRALIHTEDIRNYVKECLEGVLEHLSFLDESIQQRAEHWSVDRLGKVERNLLRIALYEIMFREDIPLSVSINEAVELAKRYGDKDSGRFVNGVLDGVKSKEVSESDRRDESSAGAADSGKAEEEKA